jgi:hypothetical protein
MVSDNADIYISHAGNLRDQLERMLELKREKTLGELAMPFKVVIQGRLAEGNPGSPKGAEAELPPSPPRGLEMSCL